MVPYAVKPAEATELDGRLVAAQAARVAAEAALAGASEAVLKGIPQPTNVEMRCVFDAMNTGIREVLGAGNDDFAAATGVPGSTRPRVGSPRWVQQSPPLISPPT